MADVSAWIGYVDLHRAPEASGGYFLGRDLTYCGRTCWVRVSTGFYTDGATVPRPLRWWIDPYSGGYLSAAIVHDGLYAAQVTSRKEADAVFFEAMLSCFVPRPRAALMWLGVRVFGWAAWRKNRERRTAMRQYVHIAPKAK